MIRSALGLLVAMLPSAAVGLSPVFEENLGQSDARAAFLGRSSAATVWFTAEGPRVALGGAPGGAFAVRFPGSRGPLHAEGVAPLPGRVSEFRGSDPACWVSGARTYERVRYPAVYPGVDVEFYWTARGLEYDLLLASAKAAGRVRLEFRGSRQVRLLSDGSAEIELAGGRVLEQRPPRAWRETASGRVPVACRFIAAKGGTLRLEIEEREAPGPVVVDPELVLLLPLGGALNDEAYAVGADAAGNLYVAGTTSSTDFPVVGAVQSTLAGSTDVFVAKLDPTGTTLLYSTYLGGSSGDEVTALAVDGAGGVVVGGTTTSIDFPLVAAFQSASRGGKEGFLARLLPDGSALAHSTYLGGSDDDYLEAVAIHGTGDALAAGYSWSIDFPTVAAHQPAPGGLDDAFLLRMSPDGSTVFSTYFGGSGNDRAYAIADSAGDVVAVGDTSSDDIPIVNPYQPMRQGMDALLVRMDPAGQTILQSTYFGGSGSDFGKALAIDGAGDIYLAGSTSSTDFPRQLAVQPDLAGDLDAFVARFDRDLATLRFSTLLGGAESESVQALAAADPGIAYFAGTTRSRDYPVRLAMQPFFGGGMWDGIVSALDTVAGQHLYSTYIGAAGSHEVSGLAVHPSGDLLVATSGSPEKLPPVPPSRPWASNEDAVVLRIKLAMDGAVTPAAVSMPSASPVAYTIRADNVVGRVVSGVKVFDVIDPCLDVSGFDPASFPAQVVTSAPATVAWTLATRTLEVGFTGDFAVDASETIDVTGLLAGAPTSSCPHTANIIHQSDPNGILRTTHIQIEGCPVLPETVTGLRAVKAGSSVALTWDPPRDTATLGFQVWKVVSGDPSLIPRASRLGAADLPFFIEDACNGATIPASAPACVDPSAVFLTPELFHYQVRGVCADGSEGPS